LLGWLFAGRDRSGCGLLALAFLVVLVAGAYALASIAQGAWGAAVIFGLAAVGGIWLAIWSAR